MKPKQLFHKAFAGAVLLASCCLWSCNSDPEPVIAGSEAKTYYKQIALGVEFGTGSGVVHKWETNLKIFVTGEPADYLLLELDKIIEEINALSGSGTKLERVSDEADANFEIFFGSGNDYAAIEPNAASYVAANWGLTWIYWNTSSVIYQGSMYVDIYRATDMSAQKHLLREELTQSLGLLNDSYDYANSIFTRPGLRPPSMQTSTGK
ncbi:MAG: DUF2927 domain-containing protein [Bacteroidia bacterium]|nr:DUF2927 domain-containing protein [Bacteroidia bacterium]